jgi:hypothetical protein
MSSTNRTSSIEKIGLPTIPSASATNEFGRTIGRTTAGTVARTIALAALLATARGATPPAHATEPAETATVAAQSAEATSPAATAEPPAAPADPVTLGVDAVSRYVWRGQVYGDAPCFQPWVSVSFAGFTLGTWGSFAFAPVHSDTTDAPAGPADATNTTEVDLFLSRSLELSIGTITATVSDYSYPSSGISYLEFAGDGTGGHTVDACVTYRGPASLPLGLCGSVNVYNDDDHAAYVETSWPFKTGSTDVSLTAGAALGKSVWYGVEKSGMHFIQAAVTASKPLKITDAFAPTLKVSWILNPYRERVALVAALSL